MNNLKKIFPIRKKSKRYNMKILLKIKEKRRIKIAKKAKVKAKRISQSKIRINHQMKKKLNNFKILTIQTKRNKVN